MGNLGGALRDPLPQAHDSQHNNCETHLRCVGVHLALLLGRICCNNTPQLIYALTIGMHMVLFLVWGIL